METPLAQALSIPTRKGERSRGTELVGPRETFPSDSPRGVTREEVSQDLGEMERLWEQLEKVQMREREGDLSREEEKGKVGEKVAIKEREVKRRSLVEVGESKS